jgi:hypothetical protein
MKFSSKKGSMSGGRTELSDSIIRGLTDRMPDIRQYKPDAVWTGYALKGPQAFFEHVEKLLSFPRGMVVIDEPLIIATFGREDQQHRKITTTYEAPYAIFRGVAMSGSPERSIFISSGINSAHIPLIAGSRLHPSVQSPSMIGADLLGPNAGTPYAGFHIAFRPRPTMYWLTAAK